MAAMLHHKGSDQEFFNLKCSHSLQIKPCKSELSGRADHYTR